MCVHCRLAEFLGQIHKLVEPRGFYDWGLAGAYLFLSTSFIGTPSISRSSCVEAQSAWEN